MNTIHKRPNPLSFRKSPGALVGGLEPLLKSTIASGRYQVHVDKSKNIAKLP